MCLYKKICTFLLIDFDLNVGVSPEEAAHFVQGSVLLFLVDFNKHVLQAFTLLSVELLNLEFIAFFKTFRFGGLDS